MFWAEILGRLMQMMHLKTLFAGLNAMVEREASHFYHDRMIADLTDDSRHVTPGGLFIARRGHKKNGADFIDHAVRQGATAVLTEPGVTVPTVNEHGESIAHLVSDDPNTLVAELAARFFGRPAEQLDVLGVTGTNGKTTTAAMAHHLLTGAGLRCGMIGTIAIDLGTEQTEPSALTTPGAIETHRIFRRMVDAGCTCCVMECSSHALDQGRLDGLTLKAAAFTNLTRDHLDYHLTMERYAAAKTKLFDLLSEDAPALINLDDAWGRWMAQRVAGRVQGYGLTAREKSEQSPGMAIPGLYEGAAQGDRSAWRAWRAAILDAQPGGTRLRIDAPDDASLDVTLPLLGRYNVSNLLAAVGLVRALGVPLEAMKPHIQTMPPVPGRLERITAPDEPFTVLVDYAHTDDALRNVLEALRPILPAGSKLRLVFGCGGERDKPKRPRMAQVACELADQITITSDNPRAEPAETILEEILAGVPGSARPRVTTDSDRRAAIQDMMERAERGDIVLIAGKGHEPYQEIAGTRHPFDDRVEARAALDRRGSRITDSTE